MPPSPRFAPFATKMREEGLPEIVVATFAHYFDLLERGETGLLGRGDIDPVEGVPAAREVEGHARAGEEALSRAVVLKLNGGLGTSMGMTRAKSLLPARGELTFLDVIVRQVLHLRRTHGVALPLLFMNSYRTREDTLEVLGRYPELDAGMPFDFVQHKVPRVRAADLAPHEDPGDPGEEWCPPGHGDLYAALQTSGTLERLLEAGFEYVFVSNSDNLGAVLDLGILGWFAEKELPFLMEVALRTEADRKGGHLARGKDGQLTLRESAQCPEDEKEDFQDVRRHRYFNTNNLWIHLPALQRTLARHGGVLPLPMIRNQKTVGATPVVQLETAMGAAISVFPGAAALEVPRTRFAPVKTTSDLLVVWSDQYVLTEDSRLLPVDEERLRRLVVDLDARHFKDIDDFCRRFAHGAPSLAECTRLVVRGNVFFGAGVTLRGDVHIQSGPERYEIPEGEVLGG